MRIDILVACRLRATPTIRRLILGIDRAVRVLNAGQVETFESCQGGTGHAYPEPTVRFHGDSAEGFRALSIAMKGRLRVRELRRVWPVLDDEPTGPWWELTFSPTTADELVAAASSAAVD